MRGISEKFLMAMKPAKADFYDEADRIINFLLEECQELNQWQPIESAPKNRRILLYCPEGQRWTIGEWLSLNGNGYWYSDEFENKLNPQHWIELPIAPELPEPPK